MNVQPDFLFQEIFSFFTFKQKIKLKLVCRKWNEFIGQQTANQRRLLVYEKRMSHSFRQTWGSAQRPVRFEERLDLKVFTKFLASGYFKNLKVLCLYRLQIGTPSPALLDCLLNLEELFIYSRHDGPSGRAGVQILQESREFSNLRTLSLQRYSRDYPEGSQKPGNFLINAPKLEKLIFSWHWIDSLWLNSSSSSIHLQNYATIRFVQCPDFDEHLQFQKFVNLEVLVCRKVSRDFQLSNYRKLRKIELFPGNYLSPTVESIIRQRNESFEHRDLAIFVCGLKEVADILLDTSGSFSDSLYFESSTLETLKSNYSKFEHSVPFPWPIKLRIKEPVGELDKLSRYFSVLNVKEIYAWDLTNSNSKCLLKFLKGIIGVRRLQVRDCSFDQTFFDELPSIAYICKLDILYWQNTIDLNYEFLTKIRFLHVIYLRLFRNRIRIDWLCQIIVDRKIDKFRIENFFFDLASHHPRHRKTRDPNLRLEVSDGSEDLMGMLFMRKFETIEQAWLFLRENPEAKPGLELEDAT